MNHATIVGLGLIGGSLGMRLQRRGWAVDYIDPAVDEGAARSAGAAADSLAAPEQIRPGSLVVLASPVDAAIALLPVIDRSLVVTSVCSVMAPLQNAAGEAGLQFLAGHPFAGSERSGLAAAREDLFEGRPWFLSSGRAEPRIEGMISDAGGVIHRIDADEHDRQLAFTSHLPQLISTALAALIARKGIDPVFLGSGLASVLRLAGSSHSVWEPVLRSNEERIDAAWQELAEEVQRLIRERDRASFEGAQALWQSLSGV